MKRVLLWAAVVLVLVANGWGFLGAWRNRTEPRGGKLELTERELRLESPAMESTVTVLRLNWNVVTPGHQGHGPAWLDAAKLAELGFDCRVAVSSPSAHNHYESMPSRPVFLALEYEGEAWRDAGTQAKPKTRLFVVDAARDPQRLRERYPDAQHYVICRGLVRLVFREGDGRTPPTPWIGGAIDSLRPDELFVPLPHSRVLRELRRGGSQGPDHSHEPRYAVRVCWGANYEPWIEGIRPRSE
jgi:hypothetical protein